MNNGPRYCKLMVHSSSHSGEDLLLNPDLFPSCTPGTLIQIYDPNSLNIYEKLVLRVPPLSSMTIPNIRFEISVLKTIADSMNLKQFMGVMVDAITEQDAEVDFVELSFRRQYLQRGNMLRFKNALIGRVIHVNQNVAIQSMQAQIQDLRKDSHLTIGGLITENTKFVFRSKSSRIVWLVQISAEMWDIDMNGELYFDKFLSEFVSPVFDSWKALGVSHMLSVIFFTRTIFLDRINGSSHPDLFSKKSFNCNDGYHQQDFFKIVLENVDNIDKNDQINKLRKEFWSFAQSCGWKIPNNNNKGPSAVNESINEFAPSRATSGGGSGTTSSGSNITCAVPTDATHGNVLEAINISLNILDKHYMDRDLLRTGNSIVVISAGSGIIKVRPRLAQITKQRMLDNAFGIDFISLSRPSIHTVPLFIVDCQREGAKDFYEIPHWMKISYIDCKRNKEESLHFLDALGLSKADDDSRASSWWDDSWGKTIVPHPSSRFLSSQLVYSTDLQSLRSNYSQLLPFALRSYLLSEHVTSDTVSCESHKELKSCSHDALIAGQKSSENNIPFWGSKPEIEVPIDRHRISSVLTSKATIFQSDVIALKSVARSANQRPADPKSSNSLLLIVDSIPNLRREKEELMATSYGSNMGEGDGNIVSSSYQGRSSMNLDDLQHGNNNNNNEDNNRKSSLPSLNLEGLSSIRFRDDKYKRQYESIISRKQLLNEISCVDDVPVTKQRLSEIFEAYDQAAGNWLCRSSEACQSEGKEAFESEPRQEAIKVPCESSSENKEDTESRTRVLSTTPGSVGSNEDRDLPAKTLRSSTIVAGKKVSYSLSPPKPSNAKALIESNIGLTPRTPERNAPETTQQGTFSPEKQVSGISTPENASLPSPRGKPSNAYSNSSSNQLLLQSAMKRGRLSSRNFVARNISALPSSGSSVSTLSANEDKPEIESSSSNVSGTEQEGSKSNTTSSKGNGKVTPAIPPLPGVAPSSSNQGQRVLPPFGPGARRAPLPMKADQSNFIVIHGKVIKVPENAAMNKKKSDTDVEYLLDYAKQSGINPFRHKEGEKYLNSVTHNRRRWAHVFPLRRSYRMIDYGLNWKSLTQPAILPLNTDYLPSIKDLDRNYTFIPYVFSIELKDCPFVSIEAAVLELVCQRLSHEFQLIDGVDKSMYMRFNKYDSVAASKESTVFYILTMGHRIHFILGDPINNKILVTQYISKKGQNEIEEKKESGVSDSSTRVSYRYEMWSPQLNKYQTVTQSFALFPDEFLWNQLDTLILNTDSYDGIIKGKKPRSLKYVILPSQLITTESEMDDYYGKFDQFIEFLNKYVTNKDEEMISITKDRSILTMDDYENDSGTVLLNKNTQFCRSTSKDFNVARCAIRGSPQHENPNWLYIKYDKVIYSFKTFHFQMEWFVCDSWQVDEFITLLNRRCAKFGLRLVQTPGYYGGADLNVHPFRPIPYIQVPQASFTIPSVHSSPLRLVERIFFSPKNQWLFDSERSTEWMSIGLPFPNYTDRDRDIISSEEMLSGNVGGGGGGQSGKYISGISGIASGGASGGANSAAAASNNMSLITMLFRRGAAGGTQEDESAAGSSADHLQLQTSLLTADSIVTSPVMPMSSYRVSGGGGKKFDRQYIHSLGLVTVRVAAQGFLWLQSASSKVSDVNMSAEERILLVQRKLRALESTVVNIVDCYEILLLDVIERAFSIVDSKVLPIDNCTEVVGSVLSESLAGGSSVSMPPASRGSSDGTSASTAGASNSTEDVNTITGP